MTTYKIVRSANLDEIVSGDGIYFRCNPKGDLIIFNANRISIGDYKFGDWLRIVVVLSNP